MHHPLFMHLATPPLLMSASPEMRRESTLLEVFPCPAAATSAALIRRDQHSPSMSRKELAVIGVVEEVVVCRTPTSKKCKIPAVARSCPPAPKKRKAGSMPCRRRLFDAVVLIKLETEEIEGLFRPRARAEPLWETSSFSQSSSTPESSSPPPVPTSSCRKRKRSSSDDQDE